MRTNRPNRCWSVVLAVAVLALAAAGVWAQAPGSAPAGVVPAVSPTASVGEAAVASPVPAAPPAGVTNAGDRSGLKAVMGVTLIIWFGLFVYVYRLDRAVRRLEAP